MVKYSSRVNTKPRKSKSVKKMSTSDQPSEVILQSDRNDNIEPQGGAISTGGAISSGGSLQTGGKLQKGKVGAVLKKVVQNVAPKVRAAVQQRLGVVLPMGGALPTGGAILQPEDIDNLSWQQMIHTLGGMDLQTYHMLQGLAAAHLGQAHPLAAPLKASLGGSFIHPKNVSRMATKDIMKAPNPQILSRALHNEWLDMMSGKDVGGGLFSSLKMLVKKGVAGGKKALSAIASGAKSAVRILSSGAMAGQMVGKSLSNAIKQGVEIANAVQPALTQLSPAAGELLGRGTELAQRGQAVVERGVQIGSQVENVLNPILGAIDAPRVGELIPVSEPQFAA